MKRLYYTAVLLFLIFGAAQAFSFTFQPLSMDFNPSGKGSIQTFRITNDSDRPIAVKISMLTREMALDGSETNGDASDLFLVFPPQVLLQPGAYQAVRVQWKGQAQVDTEKAFRIMAEQLPVRFDQEQHSGGSLNIMLKYKGSVYIVPPAPKPEVSAVRTETGTGPDGSSRLFIEVRNDGNAHVILQDLTVQLTDGTGAAARTMLLDGDSLKGINGENVLAGHGRRFSLPLPDGLGGGPLSAKLFFTPIR